MVFPEKEKYNIGDLLRIMQLLRGENGCPWDREQDHFSIRKNLIEETYEVCEAIDQKDAAMLREELGDLLLQIVFHVQIEAEEGSFSFDDVTDEICRKLIVRHPHIFGDVKVSGSDEVLVNWEAIKQQTKKQTTGSDTLRAVPKQLPALMRSEKLLGRAAKVNTAFADSSSTDFSGLFSSFSAEDPQKKKLEFGKVLFELAGLARASGVDAEEALSAYCDVYVSDFARIEALAQSEGKTLKDADVASIEKWRQEK